MWTAPSAGVLEYQLKFRCLHEFAAPSFHGALTQQESNEIEMMQKKAFSVIFGTDYRSFSNALKAQDELKPRLLMLCTSFAVKCIRHPGTLISSNLIKDTLSTLEARTSSLHPKARPQGTIGQLYLISQESLTPNSDASREY